jgi:hypothetical protein
MVNAKEVCIYINQDVLGLNIVFEREDGSSREKKSDRLVFDGLINCL